MVDLKKSLGDAIQGVVDDAADAALRSGSAQLARALYRGSFKTEELGPRLRGIALDIANRLGMSREDLETDDDESE